MATSSSGNNPRLSSVLQRDTCASKALLPVTRRSAREYMADPSPPSLLAWQASHLASAVNFFPVLTRASVVTGAAKTPVAAVESTTAIAPTAWIAAEITARTRELMHSVYVVTGGRHFKKHGVDMSCQKYVDMPTSYYPILNIPVATGYKSWHGINQTHPGSAIGTACVVGSEDRGESLP